MRSAAPGEINWMRYHVLREDGTAVCQPNKTSVIPVKSKPAHEVREKSRCRRPGCKRAYAEADAAARGEEPPKCQTCGRVITAPPSQMRRFCSVKCRAADPTFKQRIAAQQHKAAAGRARQAAGERAKRGCDNPACRQTFEAKPASEQRYCCHRCYHEHRARMFDRHIDPSEVPEMNNFDEFLAHDILHCPIEGCDWFGESLGHHVWSAHGLTASQFKRLAGFNQTQGLSGKALARRLGDRIRGDNTFTDETRGHGVAPNPPSRQAQENHDKAMALRNIKDQK